MERSSENSIDDVDEEEEEEAAAEAAELVEEVGHGVSFCMSIMLCVSTKKLEKTNKMERKGVKSQGSFFFTHLLPFHQNG